MLWLLNFFPVWVFHGILAVGIIAMVLGIIAHRIPGAMQYGFVLKLAGILLIVAGLMFEGALTLKKDYDLKEAELTIKLLEAQTRSGVIVTKIVEEVVYRDRIIVKQGQTVKEYIDKWHEAIDKTCTLSKEAVKALNDAATEPDTGDVK